MCWITSSELPGDLGEIAALPGLDPKRVKLLYDKRDVRSLEDLRRAVKSGRLRELRGFAAKGEQKHPPAPYYGPYAYYGYGGCGLRTVWTGRRWRHVRICY